MDVVVRPAFGRSTYHHVLLSLGQLLRLRMALVLLLLIMALVLLPLSSGSPTSANEYSMSPSVGVVCRDQEKPQG